MSEHPPISKISHSVFLTDVLICSLGAYGGPEAHMGVFLDQMVTRRRYLSEEEIIELIALCSILPGPTSTQTIVAIGYKVGGPVLALLTLLVWAAPVLLVMTALSFVYAALSATHIDQAVLRFIGPMAVGFIIVAAWRIGRKVVVDRLTLGLMMFGTVATYAVRAPWVYVVIMLVGALVSVIASRERGLFNRVYLSPHWCYLLLFAVFALGGLSLSLIFDSRLITLFESFYRYGYLVFGGGQVVVPIMLSELVEIRAYMTQAEFLTGYGLVQGMPGPMFSFAAYAGGLAARGNGVIYQIAGALLGGVGIFLPGVLLIFFVYPVWENLKQIRAVRYSLKGINAIAGGMILAAALILIRSNGTAPDMVLMTLLTVILLAFRRVPAPLVVGLALLAGALLP